jgi:hypothetical protein
MNQAFNSNTHRDLLLNIAVYRGYPTWMSNNHVISWKESTYWCATVAGELLSHRPKPRLPSKTQ